MPIRLAKTTGMDNSALKLNRQQVVEIKQKLRQGVSVADLAKEYEVSKTAIYDIRSGKTWSGVTENG